MPSGTAVVLDGDKSHSPPYSSSPHLANCLSSTFLAYLPTPRELWDDGRPHVGQRPAWHCPSLGLDPAKGEQVSSRAAVPIFLGREQVLGDRVRTYIFSPCRSSVGAFLSLGM